MRLALDQLGDDDLFDVCVIGAGPAGLTTALRLARAGRKVALMEGGDDGYTDWSQELYRGEVVGDPFYELDEVRVRFFGGSSNHWSGWCRTLDAADFVQKGDFADTAWPIGKDAIDPYLAEACDILEVPVIPDDEELPGGDFRTIHFEHSPPVLFGDKYIDEIEESATLFLFLDANLLQFETNGAAATGARFRTEAGLTRTLRANAYVLATGGIENSRLLLWSNEKTGGQLVRNPAALGRYWMEHPQETLGVALVNDEAALGLDGREFAGFAPSLATMERTGALNCAIGLWRSNYKRTNQIIADLACVAPDLSMWMAEQLDRRLLCGFRVDVQWEQEPTAENRIALGDEVDAVGMPLTRLHWAKTRADIHTARATVEAFGAYLAEAGLGRVRLDPWARDDRAYPDAPRIGSHHHMGGTRMAATADKGVVDADCRVFGQDNLYVAGSSIFPSGGFSNPTLPIVQFSLRLADHLLARR